MRNGEHGLRNVTLEVSLKPFHDPARPRSAPSRGACSTSGNCCACAPRRSPLCSGPPMARRSWTTGATSTTLRVGLLDRRRQPALTPSGRPRRRRAAQPLLPLPENPRRFTYGDLKALNAILKEVGREVRAARSASARPSTPAGVRDLLVQVRAAQRGLQLRHDGQVELRLLLRDAARRRRGLRRFPGGHPRGHALGVFLGRQSQHFLRDLGFDYIWFSNGFGFGLETWPCAARCSTGRASLPLAARRSGARSSASGRASGASARLPHRDARTNLSTGWTSPRMRRRCATSTAAASAWSPRRTARGRRSTGLRPGADRLDVPHRGAAGRFVPLPLLPARPLWNNSPWLDRYGGSRTTSTSRSPSRDSMSRRA